VARVAVDVPLAHLDRPFDYLVPATLAEAAVPGCRVRVRFAGRLTGGYLLERAEASDHQGTLAFLERVLSPEPVLTAEAAGLARAVADRYGGTLADVLRLAIPPRHARAEKAAPAAVAKTGADAGEARPPAPAPGPWERYPAGPSFLAALAGGRSPRAVWNALPGPDWPTEIALAAAATAASGRGTLIVVPDRRDLDALHAALAALPAAALPSAASPGSGPPSAAKPAAGPVSAGATGGGQPSVGQPDAGPDGAGRASVSAAGAGPAGVIPHSCLSAELGPAERYRRWLAGLRGTATIVAGTRSAMFAPVPNLGLVVLWDDGDDLHAEPRAPYPHAREVLALRAHRAGAAALIGGFARTAEATQLVSGGWAHPLGADRATVRRFAPAISPAGQDRELARDQAARSARIPGLALRTVRDALARGPVLFQVPRRGYLAAVACERCRAPARCASCGGPLALAGAASVPACRWCGRAAPSRVCQHCGHAGLRAVVTGAGRTAEELGRAFPSVPVRTSGRSGVLHEVPADPAVVVATPGAEPRAANGYAAAVLLDGWVLLGRPSLRAAEEALRRWMNAAALVQPAAEGGTVVVVADAGLPAVQALVRWDPVTHAERELAERAELRFPPTVRMASLTGAEPAVRDMIAAASLPPYAEVLGPVPVSTRPPAAPDGLSGPPPSRSRRSSARTGAANGRRPATDGQPDLPAPGQAQVRALIRVPRKDAAALAASLHAAQSLRSARKDTEVVRVQLDPAELI
jgi:primosomal protein N' (replication factor Y) (superfamily II helicase)